MNWVTRLIVVALLAALLVWMVLFQARRAEPPAARQPRSPAPAAVAATIDLTSSSPASAPERPVTSSHDEPSLRPPALELQTGQLPWEQKIAAATGRERNAAGRARALFALLPSLPEEALATTAEQAIERLPDADYAAVALPVVGNPQTHGQAMSVLFADLMERPDAITLPALLTIAQNQSHPYSPVALDNLRLLLGADFGNDWGQWQDAVHATLQRGKTAP
jgi:hypothetical protein